MHTLTHEEREIAAWHVEGRSQADMAGWLNVSERTVKRRIAAIRSKLSGCGVRLPDPPPITVDSRHTRNIGATAMRLL